MDVVFTTWFLQKQILLTNNIFCVPVKSHENPSNINMQIFTGDSILNQGHVSSSPYIIEK